MRITATNGQVTGHLLSTCPHLFSAPDVAVTQYPRPLVRSSHSECCMQQRQTFQCFDLLLPYNIQAWEQGISRSKDTKTLTTTCLSLSRTSILYLELYPCRTQGLCMAYMHMYAIHGSPQSVGLSGFHYTLKRLRKFKKSSSRQSE